MGTCLRFVTLGVRRERSQCYKHARKAIYLLHQLLLQRNGVSPLHHLNVAPKEWPWEMSEVVGSQVRPGLGAAPDQQATSQLLLQPW